MNNTPNAHGGNTHADPCPRSHTEPHTEPHTVPDVVRLVSRAVVLTCLLAAAALTAIELAGVPDPVAMPTAPRWFAAVMAAATVLLVLPTGRPAPRWRTLLAAGTGAGMLSGSLLAVPHSVLMLVVGVVNLVTGVGGSFEFEIPWATAGAHLAVVVASSFVLAWLVTQRRSRRGLCARCGRAAAEPPVVGDGVRRALRLLATVAVLAVLPYAALKLAWGLGARIGLTGSAFDDVTFLSPGFGDTVVLTAVSVAVSLVMGAGVVPTSARGAVVRTVTAAFGVIGSLMLVPVSVVGVFLLVTAPPTGDVEIAGWAFTMVYVCFTVWGLALAPLTALYLRATRRACRRHELPAS
ncbi:hypothetical protein [Promicromonospora panici]|uniref:hypothetical protein n=1 Tax=Promicromonospora panici TaxID=2219658 RepID=UPI00101C1FCF|nr:hypothetical protein [Promicromonospora panici]